MKPFPCFLRPVPVLALGYQTLNFLGPLGLAEEAVVESIVIVYQLNIGEAPRLQAFGYVILQVLL
tara:strand:+ start:347 stop:541 length:195 start_codon:yes stop_codon:yes gene_type:complete